MSLLSLPDELIHNLSFHLIAHTPLGPPQALLTLALTSRPFHLVVTSSTFKAKICRFMFDTGAITRRLFIPKDTDLADELHRCCNVLKEIRRADITESGDSVVDDTLVAAYILMLNNDGKNYAQLEHAGLDDYVDKFIRTRLWEGRETNQGWPLDNFNNSSALWLMWMTLTKRRSFLWIIQLFTDFFVRKTCGRVACCSRTNDSADLALCCSSPSRTSSPIFSIQNPTPSTVCLCLRSSKPLQPSSRPSKSLPSTTSRHNRSPRNSLPHLPRSLHPSRPLLQRSLTHVLAPLNNRSEIVIRSQKGNVPSPSSPSSTSRSWTRYRRRYSRGL